MSMESEETQSSRSVRWDILGVFLFGAAILLWISLLSYDPADDISRVFGSAHSTAAQPIDPSGIPNVSNVDSHSSTWYAPKAFPVNEKIQNACGTLGAIVSQALLQGTGIGAFLIAILMALSGVVCFRQRPWASPLGRSLGWSLVLIAVCTIPGRLGVHPPLSVPIGGGGYLGALVNLWMDQHVAHAGGVVVVLIALACGLLLSTEYAILRYFGYAATGSVIAAKYFGIPKWTWRRHRELTSGTFSPTRSDLPASLTLRQNPASISAPIEPEGIARFGEPRAPFAAGNPAVSKGTDTSKITSELAPDDAMEKETDDGPAIRIGRRNNATVSTTDLAGQSKPISRTDLITPKPRATPAIQNESLENDLDEEEYEDEIEEDESVEQKSDAFYEADSDDESEDFEFEEESEDEEIPAAGRLPGRSTLIRADDAHESRDSGPKVHNKKNRANDKAAADRASSEAEKEELYNELNDTKLPEGSEEYILPSLELLTEGDDFSYDEQTEEVKRKARVLEQTFANFGFNIRVVEIETGPVIAQYEIELEAGLRLSKITGLADDLAIALRVPSVRIVAPIPGKNTVGIEVPNERRQVVRMREVIEEGAGQVKKMKIPLFLGKDVSGKPLTVDLASLPHLLIAGRTGTGKSVCLNSIICSILMARRPDEVRMLMIDPKMVELSGYGRLPHLMHPVVTDMRKAEAILAWAVDKMEDRYSLLARAGVRHITSYNQLGREELHERLKPENEEEAELIPDHLPFIVIVADEMADLMMTAGKEVEAHIIRLAQKSRAVGIHLILATQKPTVDVITGLIKSNLPARISFQVASRTDSRVVLDENGADKLLGNGDMLFLWPGTSTLLRGQGTYLSDDEINAIVDHCSTGEQNFVQELVQLKINRDEEAPVKSGSFKKRDELYEAAVDIVVREGRGSCSLLQRALGIGYGRAARLIDFMAEDGIVGEYNGSQAREVVITIDDWETMRANAEGNEGSGKSRSNKIRREDGWEESPKPPKRRKRAERDVHEDMEVDAVGGGSSGFESDAGWDED
ncbi:MAG: DNA translocase FtsK [Pirellula sp.]|nr:DNA translocase FtsK [Pirellula sp.]